MVATTAGTIVDLFDSWRGRKGCFMSLIFRQLMQPPKRTPSALLATLLVAITLHRPGLWLLCRVKVSSNVRRRNRAAAFAVALAMAATAIVAPRGSRLFMALAVWVVG